MVKNKKKLEEMNADEFMLNGLDSDSENEAAENNTEILENSEDDLEEETEVVEKSGK